jgi:hypothetical protein
VDTVFGDKNVPPLYEKRKEKKRKGIRFYQLIKN